MPLARCPSARRSVQRRSHQGDDLAYTSAHVYTFDAEGRVGEFLALMDDAYHAFWARHAG